MDDKKVYAIVDRFDESELEMRKECGERHLDDIKIIGMNLVDEGQAYVYIKKRDGDITSILVDVDDFCEAVNQMIEEVNSLR